MNRVTLTLFLCLLSLPAGAEIIDNGGYTTDTSTGLDWRDMDGTIGLSYNEVAAEMAGGGIFEGWRFATQSEVESLWQEIWRGPVLSGWAVENNGITDAVAKLVGLTHSDENYRYLIGRNGTTFGSGHSISQLIDNVDDKSDQDNTSIGLEFNPGDDHAYHSYGSWLVRDTISSAPETVAVESAIPRRDNCVIRHHTRLPVSVSGSDNVDAAQIDQATLSVVVEMSIGGDHPSCHLEDSNGDGFYDLMCVFDDWQLSKNNTLSVSGRLLDGTPIVGNDTVCLNR